MPAHSKPQVKHSLVSTAFPLQGLPRHLLQLAKRTGLSGAALDQTVLLAPGHMLQLMPHTGIYSTSSLRRSLCLHSPAAAGLSHRDRHSQAAGMPYAVTC